MVLSYPANLLFELMQLVKASLLIKLVKQDALSTVLNHSMTCVTKQAEMLLCHIYFEYFIQCCYEFDTILACYCSILDIFVNNEAIIRTKVCDPKEACTY